MCHGCWDVDKKVPRECDHASWPVFTLDQLKKTLEEESKETKQTAFRIYSDAIAEKPQGHISWIQGKTTLHIDFLTTPAA